jgi:hypothetical protein
MTVNAMWVSLRLEISLDPSYIESPPLAFDPRHARDVTRRAGQKRLTNRTRRRYS